MYYKYIPLLLLSGGLLSGCFLSNKKETTTDAGNHPAEPVTTSIIKKELLPLEETTLSADEKEFGKIIELEGQQLVLDCEPFKLQEPEMLIKDDYFLLQNLNMGNQNSGMYMLFKLPDFDFVTSFGIRGNGPNEFLYPHIAPTSNPDKLAYTYDTNKRKLYKIDFDGTITHIPVEFEKVPKAVRSAIYAFAAENDTYYYTEVIPRGRALFKSQMLDGSLQTEQLYNISFSPKHKSWSAYIGDFIVHPEAKRIAYAYKYFKRILLFDPETKAAKVLDFEKEGVAAANDIITLGPDNITYYWGASCSENYIYLTYSGRSPIEVTKENQKSDGYIFVEQFDWNGNLIRKFKLNHWGRCIVDEQRNKIYQLCYAYDDPVFVYDIPELSR